MGAACNSDKYQQHKIKALDHFAHGHSWLARMRFERAARRCPERAGEIADFYHHKGQDDVAARFYERQLRTPAFADNPQLLRRIGHAHARYAKANPAAIRHLQKAAAYRERAQALAAPAATPTPIGPGGRVRVIYLAAPHGAPPCPEAAMQTARELARRSDRREQRGNG
jgi:hypothetical protein